MGCAGHVISLSLYYLRLLSAVKINFPVCWLVMLCDQTSLASSITYYQQLRSITINTQIIISKFKFNPRAFTVRVAMQPHYLGDKYHSRPTPFSRHVLRVRSLGVQLMLNYTSAPDWCHQSGDDIVWSMVGLKAGFLFLFSRYISILERYFCRLRMYPQIALTNMNSWAVCPSSSQS